MFLLELVCLAVVTSPNIDIELRDETGRLLTDGVAKVEIYEDAGDKPIDAGPSDKGVYRIKKELDETGKYNLAVKLAGYRPAAKDFVPVDIPEESNNGGEKRRVLRIKLEARWIR